MARRRKLHFFCDVCDGEVAIQDGVVLHNQMPRERDPEGLAVLSEPIWKLGHKECLKEVEPDYELSLDECSTPMQILFWTAHLAEKRQFDITDWACFIRRHFLDTHQPGISRAA